MTSNKDIVLEYSMKLAEKYIEVHGVEIDKVFEVLSKLHRAVHNLMKVVDVEYNKGLYPAVPINESVTDDYIICLEDGSKNKVLKQYLSRRYKMSIKEYKEKWNLPDDYPVVAPNSTRKRSEIAKKIGLGLRKKL
jgi:predicted transcriptional regulator